MLSPDERTKLLWEQTNLQASLQEVLGKKNQDAQNKIKFDIPDVAPPSRTVEEEQNDITKQKKDALSNLSKVVNPQVASEFLSKLNDEETIFLTKSSVILYLQLDHSKT